nr:uncharacterized protein LOC103436676 [Malus domestica]
MADSGIEIEKVEWLDPEMEFLASKRETGNEWELFKENVRPLKRGRKVAILNEALKVHNDNQLKMSLLDQRRLLIQAIDEYKGEDPLHPWLECIKWVQEAFPPGGDSSGLVVIYEQCVRTFWHSDRYKDDLRYLKVWLEYAENCVDAQVIYSFLDANEIGKTHAVFYISRRPRHGHTRSMCVIFAGRRRLVHQNLEKVSDFWVVSPSNLHQRPRGVEWRPLDFLKTCNSLVPHREKLSRVRPSEFDVQNSVKPRSKGMVVFVVVRRIRRCGFKVTLMRFEGGSSLLQREREKKESESCFLIGEVREGRDVSGGEGLEGFDW